MRASNTQPALVMRCEATTTERLAEIKAALEAPPATRRGRRDDPRSASTSAAPTSAPRRSRRARTPRSRTTRRRSASRAIPRSIVERLAQVIEQLTVRAPGPRARRCRSASGIAAMLRDRQRHGRELAAPALARRPVRRAARDAARRAVPDRRLQRRQRDHLGRGGRRRRARLPRRARRVRRHRHRRRRDRQRPARRGRDQLRRRDRPRQGPLGRATPRRARAASAAASRPTSAAATSAADRGASSPPARRSSAIGLAGGIDAGHTRATSTRPPPRATTWALALWTELAPLLAVALGNAIAVLNPERLVLGGGMLGRAPTLYELVQTTLPIVDPGRVARRG